MTRPVVPIALFALGLGAGAYALLRTQLPAPVAWTLALEGGLLLGLARPLRGVARVVAVNLGLIALVLLGFELALLHRSRPPEEVFSGSYTDGYWERHHPVLGYRPAPGRVSTSTKHQGGQLVYTVTYTIGDDALRLAPPMRPDADTSIVFFGGSHIFGEGVNDEETAPYRLGVLSGGAYEVVNFGFHGYGPHQMLAALESGYAAERILHPPRDVIYLGGPYHDPRVEGEPWDPDGPHYVIGPDGHLIHTGRFRDHRDARTRLRERFATRVRRSGIARAVLERIAPAHRSSPEMYVAVVDSARRAVERLYPTAHFHVLFWDTTPTANAYIARLRARGLVVHPMSEVLPALADDPHAYQLSPLDGHPNAAAHDLIARYVLDTLIAGEPSPRPRR